MIPECPSCQTPSYYPQDEALSVSFANKEVLQISKYFCATCEWEFGFMEDIK